METIECIRVTITKSGKDSPIVRYNILLFSYLLAIFDRDVFQRAEQVSDDLPFAKSPVVDHSEFDSLIL